MNFFRVGSLMHTGIGIDGTMQYRSSDLRGGTGRILLRGGVFYSHQSEKTKLQFTLGDAFIHNTFYDEIKTTRLENRLYQQIALPHQVGSAFLFRHRLQLEERLVIKQDFFLRWRYQFKLDVLLNKKEMTKGTLYLALSDEIFIHGQHTSADQPTLFNQNRAYGALGYSITRHLRTQGGYMQEIRPNVSHGQLQVSLHQSF